MTPDLQNLAKAKEAWGALALPDWIEALARACDQGTQDKVAKRIGYSASLVSSILSAKYTGDRGAVEKAVRDALMRVTVDCPVLGEIQGSDCRAHQGADFIGTNSLRVQLYRACRGKCPHSRIGGRS